MRTVPCEYLDAPEEMLRIDATGREQRVDHPPLMLCGWGEVAAARMKDMPPFVGREARGGHHWRPGDCDACPCYVAKL